MSNPSTAILAERHVASNLKAGGWKIFAHDLRTPFAQIDVLAVDPDGILVAVEVKARHPTSWSQGTDCLERKQLSRLKRSLEWLLATRFNGYHARVDRACATLPDPTSRPLVWYRDL